MSIEKLIEANTTALLTLASAIASMGTTAGKAPEKAVEVQKSMFDDAPAETTKEAPAKKQAKAPAKSTESSTTSGSKPAADAAPSAPDVAVLRKELTEVVVSVAKMDAEGVAATRAILNGDYGVKKASEVPDAKVSECLAKFKAAKAKLEGGAAQEPDEEDFT